jgi:hypothetical protein
MMAYYFLLNTSMMQQKYNLFREASEGYAKVLAELHNAFDEQNVHIVVDHLHSLIGTDALAYFEVFLFLFFLVFAYFVFVFG